MNAAHMMAVFDTNAVVTVCGCGFFGVGGVPAEARHECWAPRGGGVGCGGAVAVSVSVGHFDGLLLCVYV
jgi:hypothetical protein